MQALPRHGRSRHAQDRTQLLQPELLRQNAMVHVEGVYFALGAAPLSVHNTYFPPRRARQQSHVPGACAMGKLCKRQIHEGAADAARHRRRAPLCLGMFPYNMGQLEMYVAYHDTLANCTRILSTSSRCAVNNVAIICQ